MADPAGGHGGGGSVATALIDMVMSVIPGLTEAHRPIIAFCIALVAVGVPFVVGRSYQSRKDESAAYKDLDQAYLGLYQAAQMHAFVLDPAFTYDFHAQPRAERLVYEAYAFRVWVLCETVHDLLGFASPVTIWSYPQALLEFLISPAAFRAVFKHKRPFLKELEKCAYIARSPLKRGAWETWKSALDIEARLHIAWLVAEMRFERSFKPSFKRGVTLRYLPHVDEMRREAMERFTAPDPAAIESAMKDFLKGSEGRARARLARNRRPALAAAGKLFSARTVDSAPVPPRTDTP